MNNVLNNGRKPTPKRGMVSELKKGTKFINPITDELVYVTYKDEACIGVGPSVGYTTGYIRETDSLWNKAVDLS